VLIVFMLLAALNFVTHFLAFRQRSLAAYRHDPEVRGVLGLVVASCLGISLYVWQAGVYPAARADHGVCVVYPRLLAWLMASAGNIALTETGLPQRDCALSSSLPPRKRKG
jgi:Trk-type K+ transport system membrane component